MIKKIKLPQLDEFYEKYMKTLSPVVISDLFVGEPIRNIASKEAAISAIGKMRIGVQPEYGSYENVKGDKEPGGVTHTMSLVDYFKQMEIDPSVNLMSMEYASPDELKSLFKNPECCTPRKGESEMFKNQVFIGNKGKFAHLHLDKLGAHGFLYQVFGRKTFYTFPIEATKKLMPYSQVSMINLENFGESDKRDFLKYTGGEKVVLEAGDCMYVPAMSWHYVEYPEDSLSISFRFRRPDRVTKIVNMVTPGMYMQGLAILMIKQDLTDTEKDLIISDLTDLWRDVEVDGVKRQINIDQLAKEIYCKYYQYHDPYFMEYEKFMPALIPQYDSVDNKTRKIYS